MLGHRCLVLLLTAILLLLLISCLLLFLIPFTGTEALQTDFHYCSPSAAQLPSLAGLGGNSSTKESLRMAELEGTLKMVWFQALPWAGLPNHRTPQIGRDP